MKIYTTNILGEIQELDRDFEFYKDKIVHTNGEKGHILEYNIRFNFEFNEAEMREYFDNDLLENKKATTTLSVETSYKFNRFIEMKITLENFAEVFPYFTDFYSDLFFAVSKVAQLEFNYQPQKLLADMSKVLEFSQDHSQYTLKQINDTFTAIRLMYNFGTFPSGYSAYHHSPPEYIEEKLSVIHDNFETPNHSAFMNKFGTMISRIDKNIYKPLGQKKYGGILGELGQEIAKSYLNYSEQKHLIKVLVKPYSFGKEELAIEEDE